MKGATRATLTQMAGNMISIHAPVKGATSCHPLRDVADGNFNPRSREGSDPGPEAAGRAFCDFNPRSREGSDVAVSIRELVSAISIHAPVKGATDRGQ